MKNKVWAVLLAAVLALGYMAVPAAATESWALQDGSFEAWGETGEAGAWKVVRRSTGSVETTEGRSGYGVKISSEEDTRICLFQDVGAVPTGTILEVSVWVKIIRFGEGSGFRLLSRYGDLDGTAGEYTNYTTTTDSEWMELKYYECVTRTENLFIHLDMNRGSAFEVLIDDVSITSVSMFPLSNPNFDTVKSTNEYASWTNHLGSGQTDSVVQVDSETNSNVAYFTEHGYISQTVPVSPNTTYRLSFDFKSTGPVATVKLEGKNSISKTFGTTNNEWKRRYVDITTVDGSETLNIMLRYVWSEEEEEDPGYEVSFDNILFEQVDDNLLANGDFEYSDFEYSGFNWSGEVYPTNGVFPTIEETADAFSGTNALTMTAASGTNGSLLYSLLFFPEHEETIYYELSCYIKVSSASQVNIGTENHKVKDDGSGYTGSKSHYGEFKNLVTGKWMKITKIIPVLPEERRTQMKLRVIGGGTVTFDKVSLRPLEDTTVYFSEADGAYTETLTDGGKVTINTLVPSGSAKTAILAIYCDDAGSKRLADVQILNTTETNATNGYASLTLTAGTIPDFADKDYYAKVILLDGAGTMVPLEDVITLTK